jgi:hypothetical protein
MLRNFLVVDEGRHHNMGRFLADLDYVKVPLASCRGWAFILSPYRFGQRECIRPNPMSFAIFERLFL